jgi:hypothetical protein
MRQIDAVREERRLVANIDGIPARIFLDLVAIPLAFLRRAIAARRSVAVATDQVGVLLGILRGDAVPDFDIFEFGARDALRPAGKRG